MTGTPCSLKDAACLTDRKPTNNEEYGTTLILSVDDEPVNHMVIEECISSTGYKVGNSICRLHALLQHACSIRDKMRANACLHAFCRMLAEDGTM